MKGASRLWRREGALLACLGVLVVVLVAVVAGGPGVGERLAGEALASRMEQVQRGAPGVVHSARFDPEEVKSGQESDFGADLARYAEAAENASPRGLDGRIVHDSTRIQLPGAGVALGRWSRVSFVYASDAPGRRSYVEGRAPRARGTDVELAVSARTRDALGLRVGQRIALGPGALLNVDAVGVVVGVFRAEGAARLWSEVPALVRPRDGAFSALVAPRGVEVLQSQAGAELTVAWNMRLVLDGRTAGRYVGERGERDVQRLMARYPADVRDDSCAGGGFGGKYCMIGTHPSTELDTDTELPESFAEFGRQWREGAVVISFATASLIAVGAAAVVVTALLAVRRGAPGDRLRRARGASAAGLALERAVRTSPILPLGFAGGCAVAGALPGGPPSYGAGLAVAVLCWLPAPLLTWGALRDGAVLRGRGPAGAGRRVVVEVLVLVLAAGGVFALRARGTEGVAGPDPLLAAVPALLGLATVAVLVRCYPLPVRLAARWSAGRRGAVPLIALSRAAKEAPARGLALLVLVVTLAAAVFGGLVSGTLLEGRREAVAWQVGADASFLGAARDPATAQRLARARGVRTTVTVRQLRVDPVSSRDGGRYGIASLVGVDGAKLREAAGGSVVGRALADAGLSGSGRSRGGERVSEGGGGASHRGGWREVRVLASGARPGEVLTFALHGKEVRLRVVGALPDGVARDPALGPVRRAAEERERLVLADNRDLGRFAASDVEEAALLLYGAHLDTAELRSLVPRAAPGSGTGELRIRTEEQAEADDDGLIAAIATAHTGCAAVTVLLALVALVLELLLSAPARGRTTARLRTLGLGGRATSALHLLQLLPLVLAAVAGGAALGLTLPALLGPALDLREFTGGPTAPGRHTDVLFTAALGAGLCVLVAVAVGVETWLGRRRGLGAVLRLGRSDD
ncbi:hypothetical protein ACFWZ2_40415 [Streptomyces sp. NPDC059002]|uniref:hypothetical protein n=1 Tax=Streptomyces sp. NPDC059002 TaxID=3346690 RepID=UPI0036762B73